MSLLSLVLACAVQPVPPPAVVRQEPPPKEQEEEIKPPPKQAFAKLSGSQRKQARGALAALRGGRTVEARAEGYATLQELGEGVVPLLLGDWAALVEAERLAELQTLLDALLAADALHLAWQEVASAAPGAARAYVVRRWRDSDRKDLLEFLGARLSDADPEVAYAAAVGLLRRGDTRGWQPVVDYVTEHWVARAAAIRADFAGLERGPLTGRAAAALDARKRTDRLAGLHLFELFGVPEQAALLMPALSESDTTLRLAAIDAARAVVDGAAPLERPSMTEIIERAEAWKKRIREARIVRPEEGGR